MEINKNRKKVIKINPSQTINKELYKIFMIEKQNNLEPSFKNAIDLFFKQIEKSVDVFIVFGSVAHGIQNSESDIDILVVSDKSVAGLTFDFEGKKIEVHQYSWQDFRQIKDFVVLECLLNGILYKGDIFDIVQDIKSVPKSYLIFRLNKSKQLLKKAGGLDKEAKEYFYSIAQTTIGEIVSLIEKKQTITKRKINISLSDSLIKDIEQKLAKEGDLIWIN
jgi:predicted nucleotidyltransferase